MVKHFSQCRLLISNAISVTALTQFKLLWCQYCDLIRREQASSKVWLIRPRSFHCLNGMIIVYCSVQ